MRPTIRLRTGCILLLLFTLAGCGADSQPAHSKLDLLDLNGQSFDFWRANQSSIVVAVFTRTDCPVSNRFAPEIRRLWDQYHARGVEFFLIYVDPREDASEIRKHLQEYS